MTKKTQQIFFLFIFTHTIIWTLVPTLTNNNLPLDTIEAIAWGSNLDWGFNKHPPLSAISVELIYRIFGNNDWAYYFLSQLYVCFTFLIIWYFSQDFFKKRIYSLISILLLSGIYFYNYTTPEFNVYICELPFWALTVFFLWRGFKHNKGPDWLLMGLFGGLGMLSHYLFLYLLISVALFLFYMIAKKKIDTKCFISLFTFFLIICPHLIWLSENNYTTLTYGIQRTGLSEGSFFNHLKHPIVFFGKQIGILSPFFIMIYVIISKFKIKISLKDNKLLFLLFINILPLILIFLTSMLIGIKIRTMWMTPFYMFFGVLFVYIFQKQFNLNKIKNFVFIFAFLFTLSPSVYSYVSISQDNKRTDYPGKEIADLVERRWDKNFSNEIGHVIGDEWFGGNLSYHLSSRPKWSNKLNPDIVNSEGVIYTGNAEVLKKVCPGIFGKIKSQGICMIGSR